MVSLEDEEQLNRATQLLRDVVARHRDEDLRAVTILTDALQDIRIAARYLGATAPRALRP